MKPIQGKSKYIVFDNSKWKVVYEYHELPNGGNGIPPIIYQEIKPKNMKYVSLILLFNWSLYILTVMPHLKPSDNLYLWVLAALTFMYTTVNIIITLIDLTSKRKT